MKYTFLDLQQIEDDLKEITSLDKEQSFEYVYALRKILREIKKQKELIRECLKEPDESFQSYQKEMFDLAKECGGEVQRTEAGVSVDTEGENFDEETFENKKEEIEERYEEALERQSEINKNNTEIITTKQVEVDLPKVPKEAFSDTINFNELPDSILDLIQ